MSFTVCLTEAHIAVDLSILSPFGHVLLVSYFSVTVSTLNAVPIALDKKLRLEQ